MSIRTFFKPTKGIPSFVKLPTATKIAWILVVLILLASIPSALFARASIYNELATRSLEPLELSAQVAAQRITFALQGEAAALQAAAVNLPASAEAAEPLEALVEQSDMIEIAALVGADQQVIAVYPDSEFSLNDTDFSEFDALLANPAVGPVMTQDSLIGSNSVYLSAPVTDAESGEVIGVLVGIIDPSAIFAGHPSTPQTGVYLPDGELFFASSPRVTSVRNDVEEQILEEGTGAVISTIGQSPPAYGYARISDLSLPDSSLSGMDDWIITSERPASTILPEIEAISRQIAFLILGVGLGLCVLTMLVSYIVSRPLLRLARTAEHIIETDTTDQPLLRPSAYDAHMLSAGLQDLMDRLEHRAMQLDAAAAISRERVSRDVQTLLQHSTELIFERMGYPAIYIYLTEDNNLRARVAAVSGKKDARLLEVGKGIVLSEGSVAGRGLLKRQTEWYEGLKASFAGKKDEPAELLVPFPESTAGGLHIIGDGPNSFSEPDVAILQLIGHEIGSMLENRSLFEEAEAAREVAQQASRIKSQFLANMSHELRTPLNAILNFTGFVADGDVGPINEEQKDLLDKVYSSGEHLLNLINDILDLSKIEAGMMQFLMEEFELNKVLEGTLSTAKALVKERPVELLAEIEPELPKLMGDKRRLRQVFLNLISNAIKFTIEGHVKVRAFRENDTIHVSIEDTGIGIPPEDHHTVFETFKQAKHDLEVSGTGLGLSISKHFIEAHGGKIWLESQVGEGTTFHVTLPVHVPVTEVSQEL